MRLRKSLQLSWNILIHSKLRSWLTIIGIIIGIASVVSILSISSGAQKQLSSSLGKLGADILTVAPGASRAMGGTGFAGGGRFISRTDTSSSSSSTQKNLTIKDIDVIKTIPNVEYAMGEVSGSGSMTYLTKSSNVQVTGVDATIWKDITTSTLSSGRMLTTSDTDSIVIGYNLANSVFSDIPLNSKVTIEGKSFKVVGILSSGNEVYMPIQEARDTFTSIGTSEFDSILVKVSDDSTNATNQTITKMTSELMMERGILQEKNVDFSISNPASMQSTISSSLNTLSIFLGAIAAIALIVGAIGIANTMFTSVLEKTKEIGIMKAIGAKNRNILSIFLINAGMIGMVGGLGGIILGTIGAGLISSLASSSSSSSGGMFTNMFSSTSISVGLLLGALAFSIIIGMIAGAIPAYRASKLKPVDALRYE